MLISIRRALEPLPISDKNAQNLFKLIKRINHPNVMSVEFFIDAGIFYVVRSYDDDFVCDRKFMNRLLKAQCNSRFTILLNRTKNKASMTLCDIRYISCHIAVSKIFAAAVMFFLCHAMLRYILYFKSELIYLFFFFIVWICLETSNSTLLTGLTLLGIQF